MSTVNYPKMDGKFQRCARLSIYLQKKLTETLGLFYPPTKHGNICLKLYDECEEIHSAVIENGEFFYASENKSHNIHA